LSVVGGGGMMRPRWRSGGILAALIVVVAVTVSSVAGQRARQRIHGVVRGSSRREVYRTSYTRERARARHDELVPEVININIEKEEQTRMC